MVASILLSVVTLGYAAADTIGVGHPAVQAMLPIGTDIVDGYALRDGDRQLVVSSIQTTTRVTGGYLIVQENRSANGALLSLDSVVVAEGTLATVRHGDVTPNGRRHVRFTGGRLDGVTVDTLGREETVTEEVPAGLFDYSIMALIADRLPLSTGYRATIATYDITRGPVYVPLEVVGEEDVNLGGETLGAWKVHFDLGPQTVTRWIDRETRRELRWSVMANGRVMIGERRRD